MKRLDIIKSQFPNHYESALAIPDPSGRKHKYLLWIANQLSRGHNPPDISQTIKFFDNNCDKFQVKDIYKYEDLKELEDLVKEIGLSNRQAKMQDKEGAEKIYEDDQLMVIRIENKQAMIFYGANTKWCVTMKDHAYYENYVADGHDFYVVIRKDLDSLKFAKYAIVKKGTIEFSIYDEMDNSVHSFSEKEHELLTKGISAIVLDKSPPNYIRLIVEGKVSQQEAAEWVQKQTPITRTFLEDKCPYLKIFTKTPDEIIEDGVHKSRHFFFKAIDCLDETKRIEIINVLATKLHPKYTQLKIDILVRVPDNLKLILYKTGNVKVRCAVAKLIKSPDFLKDKSSKVFRSAASTVDLKDLFEYLSKSNSKTKKKVITNMIVEKISVSHCRQFIATQPISVLKELTERSAP